MNYDIVKTKARMIKGRVALAGHVGRSVALAQVGDKFYGKTPFAENGDERSLVVRTSDQRFKCRVTGARGDIFDWENLTAGREFCDAVNHLAEHYGIDLSPNNYFASSDRERAAAVAAFLRECNALGLREAS